MSVVGDFVVGVGGVVFAVAEFGANVDAEIGDIAPVVVVAVAGDDLIGCGDVVAVDLVAIVGDGGGGGRGRKRRSWLPI